jgi:predicted component of type VI protein secretion system
MASLKVLSGSQQGRTIDLEGDRIVLGRDAGVGIDLSEPGGGKRSNSISRKHAVISRVGGKYFIEDGDGQGKMSRGGTYVNDYQVPFPERRLLEANDRIRICDFVAAFVDPTASPSRLLVRAIEPLSLAGGVSTPDYLAPRQVAEPDDGPVKEAADDLHAAGVMAFHMLLGRLPFPAEPLMARLDAIAQRRFDSAAEGCRLAGTDAVLAPLIDRALAGNYASAAAWRAELDRAAPPVARRAKVGVGRPESGERFEVERLLFEDVLSEAHEVRGVRSGGRFTLRLFKPGFHSPPFLRILRDLPGTGG